MQSGDLVLTAPDAFNFASDPKATNPTLYRSTGTLSSGAVDGYPCVKATLNATGSAQIVIDKRFYVDVEGFNVGDKIYWSADVRVTAQADIQMVVDFFDGASETTASTAVPQAPSDGWKRHYGVSTVTAAPAGGFLNFRIHTVGASLPAGQGFYFRNLSIQKNQDVGYFDGGTSTPSFKYSWNGAENNSTSARRVNVSTDSIQWVSRVLVAGVEREVTDWSTDREISGGLPSSLSTGGSGITQATGGISFAGQDVQIRPQNPFTTSNGWVPNRGDLVQIFVSDGFTEWQQFHGLIDKVSGDVQSGINATVIDHYDKLSAEARHVPLLRGMPPLNAGGGDFRYPGLTALYYVDHFLRLAGFNCTPRVESNPMVVAHGQSSIWPAVGTLNTAVTPNPAVTEHPTVNRAPWGISMSGFTATYLPARDYGTSDPLQITMCVAPEHAGTGYVRARCAGASQYAQLLVNLNRRAIAYVDGTAIVGIDLLPTETAVSALFKGTAVTIMTSTGRTVTGTATRSGGLYTTALIMADDNARIAGMQISSPSNTASELVSPQFKPTAHFDTAQLSLMSFMDAAPSFKGTPVNDVLTNLCESKLSSMWIDELGVMQWADAETLESKLSARGVTTLDDIISMSWEVALMQSASKVTIKSQRPAITVGRYKNRVLVEGGGSSESLKSNDELEIFLEPGSDETWIMPNFSFTEVGGATGSWTLANDPERSLVGMYYTSDGGTTETTGLTCTITTEVLDYEKFLIRYEAGTWPSDVEGVISTSPTNTNLWPKNQNKDLPKLVGQGKVAWSEREYSISDLGGNGPELVHETGVWCSRQQDETILVRYAEFLRDHVIAPKPIVNGMEIVPDPRLQLGDVIYVRSDALLGARFRALIVSKSTSFGDDGLSMTLGVRVLTVDPGDVTYEGWQQALPVSVSTYADFNNFAPTPQTYAEFNEG